LVRASFNDVLQCFVRGFCLSRIYFFSYFHRMTSSGFFTLKLRHASPFSS
jgi:hypothetical protein